jgi:inner membrane protein
MNWPEHMFIGALFGIAAALILNAGMIDAFFLVGVASLSSLVPDIDHDSSKIRKAADIAVPIGAFAFSIASTCSNDLFCILPHFNEILILGLAITGLYMIVLTFLRPKHRGITHTLFSAAVFGLILYFFSGFPFALAGFAGYASHLFADKHIKVI